jgi:hypothetical protein
MFVVHLVVIRLLSMIVEETFGLTQLKSCPLVMEITRSRSLPEPLL